MTRYYLGRFIGDGTEPNPFRAPADTYSIIDLRGDSTQLAGYFLISVPTRLQPMPAGWRDLGEALDFPLSSTIRSQFTGDLSLNVDATTVRGIITELLLIHGRPAWDQSRWNPLKADSRGRHRIVLGDEVIFDGPVVVGTVIQDQFDRANETPLASPWTMAYGTGTNNIASNVLTSTNAGQAYYRYDSGDMATDDHYAEITNVNITNATDYHGPIVRFDPGAHTCYLGSIREVNPATARILKVVSGSITTLVSSDQTVPVNPWTLKLWADGSVLTLTCTKTTTISTTDTDITGNTRVGFTCRNFTTNQTADYFAAADIAHPTSASVRLPGGEAGRNRIQTPDHASLDITSDLEIIACVSLDDWTPAALTSILAKRQVDTAVGYAYQFSVVNTSGVLRIGWWDTGTVGIRTLTSPVGLGWLDGQPLWVRVVFDANNGASQCAATFYYSPDSPDTAVGSLTWIPLGATVVAATVAAVSSNAQPLWIGSRSSTNDVMTGNVYYVELKDTSGTTVVDVDFRDADQLTADGIFTDTQGRVFTLRNLTSWEGTPPGAYPYPDYHAVMHAIAAGTAHLVNMPPAVAADDLIIVSFINQGSATVTTPGGGWTQLFSQANSTLVRLSGYALKAAGTEGGTTVDFVTSASEEAAAEIYRIPAALWSGTLADVAVGTAATGISTTPNPPSLTHPLGSDDYLWMAFYGAEDDDDIDSNSEITNFAYMTYVEAAIAGTIASGGSARGQITGATVDPGIFTMVGSEEWVANTIAIPPVVGLTAVGKNLELRWDTRAPIGEAIVYVWDVRAAVGDISALVWDVRATIGDTSQSIWDVRVALGEAIALTWDTGGTVGDTSQLVWDVRAALAEAIQVVWDVRTFVGDSISYLWDLRAVLSDASSLLWDVRVAFGESIVLRWDTAFAFGEGNVLIWDVQASLGDSTALVWDAFTFVGDSTALVWDVAAAAAAAFGESSQLVWDVRANVSDTINLIWDVLRDYVILRPATVVGNDGWDTGPTPGGDLVAAVEAADSDYVTVTA